MHPYPATLGIPGYGWKNTGSHSPNYFSGTDEERLEELQAMLDMPEINAILFGRGGYGVSRIIDRIEKKKIQKNPKWLIGFSDITVIHTHVLGRYQISTLHAPMAAAFREGNGTNNNVLSLKRPSPEKLHYTCAHHAYNRKGKTTGSWSAATWHCWPTSPEPGRISKPMERSFH